MQKFVRSRNGSGRSAGCTNGFGTQNPSFSAVEELTLSMNPDHQGSITKIRVGEQQQSLTVINGRSKPKSTATDPLKSAAPATWQTHESTTVFSKSTAGDSTRSVTPISSPETKTAKCRETSSTYGALPIKTKVVAVAVDERSNEETNPFPRELYTLFIVLVLFILWAAVFFPMLTYDML